MVVDYPSSARGSATSFFLYAPRLIFWYKGSTIPNVLPQALIAQALAYAAYQNKELYEVGGNQSGIYDPGGAWGWLEVLVSTNFTRLVLGCIESTFCK